MIKLFWSKANFYHFDQGEKSHLSKLWEWISRDVIPRRCYVALSKRQQTASCHFDQREKSHLSKLCEWESRDVIPRRSYLALSE